MNNGQARLSPGETRPCSNPPARVYDQKDQAIRRGAWRVSLASDGVSAIDSLPRVLASMPSVGKKKRVSIATVLAMDLELLALDEPSAGLDPRARRDLINLLRDRPLTMLVSTHDMLMARDLFSRTVIMNEGRVVVDGPTERILADDALLTAHGLERP